MPASVSTAHAPAPAPAPSARRAHAPAPPTHASAPAHTSLAIQAGPPAVRLSPSLSNPSMQSVPGVSGGESLAPAVQGPLESSLQVNLQSVRVHTDTRAQAAAGALSARAFTVGNHIFLGPGEQATDLGLMGHEAAHVVQQQGAPTLQRWGTDRSDHYEREAHQASAAVLRHESFEVHEHTAGPRVQGWGIADAWNYIANKANLLPGFRMLTIILGVNPINMSRVAASPANILRAVIEFLPGGALITQALDNSGAFEKVGNWVAQQIKALGLVGSAIWQAVKSFVDKLGVRDIFRLDDVWERGKRIVTEPIDRIIAFARGLVTGIVQLVKDAILKPIAKLAEGTAGYSLLKAVLGKDPITSEPVPQTAETILGPFMKLIGQEEIWENMKKARAIPRAMAWFRGALSGLTGFVKQIPSLFISAFKSLELADIVLIPRAFAKLANVFGGFLGRFINWAGNTIWTLLEIIFDVVSPAALRYIKKTGAALKSILKNPLPFVGNLVKTAKLGFENFADHFGDHLKTGLIDWLAGSLEGVYIPKALSLLELGKCAISVLGVTWAQIRGKIVKVLGPSGETIMKGLETGFDIVVALVTGGPAAAWELIKDKLNDLKDQVIDGIVSFVTSTVIKKAVPKLIAMFIPGAGFISAILSIYDTITVFVEKISKIIQVVTAFIDSIVNIAAGNIGAATKRVESILAGLLSLAISFLAGFLGLGKITDKIKEVIEKVRAKVDQAIDKAIEWIVDKAKKLFGKKDKPEEDKVGGSTVKEGFSMGPADHTLTATWDGKNISITMASREDIVISAQLGNAIGLIETDREVNDNGQPVKRDPSQKKTILEDLAGAKEQVDKLCSEYQTHAKTVKLEPFDKFAAPRLAKIIGNLTRLAKKKPEITSLKPLISFGRPRYIPKVFRGNIRKILYDALGGWSALSKRMRDEKKKELEPQLSKIWLLRNDTSKPNNYGIAQALWISMQTDRKIPSEKKAPSFATYNHPRDFNSLEYETDHNPSLGKAWNEGENNQSDDKRKKTLLGEGVSKLRVLTKEENQERAHDKNENPDFKPNVGPNFESEIANSPRGSMLINGKFFDDTL